MSNKTKRAMGADDSLQKQVLESVVEPKDGASLAVAKYTMQGHPDGCELGN